MCGILAIFNKKMPKNLKTILESCQSLKNRGPDKTVSRITSTGIYMFHRLAINDTSSRGDHVFTRGHAYV